MDILVKKGALSRTRLAQIPQAPLSEGDVRLRVDLFSLTANNVTYGATGDQLGYWRFFPSPEEGWGRAPVWGFATVSESLVAGIRGGERVYGFLPMSDEIVIRPGPIRNGAFADTALHRQGLAPVYNSYVFTSGDSLYSPGTEALQALFRPLFTTSFLIDDFMAEAGFFGARQIILSSASSKTAYAAAERLSVRRAVRVIGLTSPANAAFTSGLGVYDGVLSYDGLEALDATEPALFIDIAGNQQVREAVHRRLDGALRYSCAVGATHWDAPRSGGPLRGPKPEMFFAPDVARKRIAAWGLAGFSERIGDAWAAFLPFAARTTSLAERHGLEAAGHVFSDLASGRTRPADGHVIRLD
jgi:hypothetical protein